MRYRLVLAGVLLALGWYILCGCQSSSDAQATTPKANGASASFTINWPARGRLIPPPANSIVLKVVGPYDYSTTTLVPRPLQGGSSTIQLTNLPIGDLTFTAAAYPNIDGTGTAQAIGSNTYTTVVGENFVIAVTMLSTINHLSITPTNPSVIARSTKQLSLSALDAGGNIVMLVPTDVSWRSSNEIVASVDSASGLVTGVSPGQATIYADVQGFEASVTVTVINGIAPPTAIFTVTPAAGDTTTSFQFDASPCSDTADLASALQVQWDWTNSGTFTPYTTTKTATHQYATPGTYTVTMRVENTHSMTATYQQTVTVNPPITMTPTSVTMSIGDTQTFNATIYSNPSLSPIWNVEEANGGSITSAGVYTAPMTPGTYHIDAQSPNNSSIKCVATVTVKNSSAVVTVN